MLGSTTLPFPTNRFITPQTLVLPACLVVLPSYHMAGVHGLPSPHTTMRAAFGKDALLAVRFCRHCLHSDIPSHHAPFYTYDNVGSDTPAWFMIQRCFLPCHTHLPVTAVATARATATPTPRDRFSCLRLHTNRTRTPLTLTSNPILHYYTTLFVVRCLPLVSFGQLCPVWTTQDYRHDFSYTTCLYVISQHTHTFI